MDTKLSQILCANLIFSKFPVNSSANYRLIMTAERSEVSLTLTAYHAADAQRRTHNMLCQWRHR